MRTRLTPASTSTGRRSGSCTVAGLVALLALSTVVALATGPAAVDPLDVLRSAWAHVGPAGTEPLGVVERSIVWDGRAPRIVCAAAVGAGLAVVGTVLQALTGNPLADPYLLGVSSGAAAGAVTVLVLAPVAPLSVAAFAGAVAALLATLTLAGPRALQPSRVVLAGIVVGQLSSAAVSLVLFVGSTGDSYREVIDWLMGSVSGVTWSQATLAAGTTLAVSGALIGSARTLDALLLGEAAAQSLGVGVDRARWTLFAASALLTAVLVSVSGAIGFVGLVIPHLLRLLGFTRHRVLLPLAALTGGLYLLWADTLARTVLAPVELPVGIVTAALGAPAFAWLLARRGTPR